MSEGTEVDALKGFRSELDGVLQRMKAGQPKFGRERALAITHLEDAILRLGVELKDRGGE